MLLLDRNEEFHAAFRVLLARVARAPVCRCGTSLGRTSTYRELMMSRVITVGALLEVALVIHLRAPTRRVAHGTGTASRADGLTCR